MRLSKKLIYLLLATGLLFFLIGFLISFQVQSTRRSSSKDAGSKEVKTEVISSAPLPSFNDFKEKARVLRVIDGDTIEVLLNGETKKVRYIGIDTPETVDLPAGRQAPRKPLQCFGKEAWLKNKELVEGKEVELEKDVSETDKFGRLLRYIYVIDTVLQPQNETVSSEQIFVNEYLVKEGYAYAATFPPDVKYQERFVTAQKEAQAQNRGLWSACGSVESSTGGSTVPGSPPATIQKDEAVASPSQTWQGGCVIKGNISSSGKIYHLPGCGSYDKTVINELQGERWFCTEDEAVAAGWRKAKNC